MSLSSLFKITLNCTFHKGRKWAESGSSTYIDLNNQKGISSFFGLCSLSYRQEGAGARTPAVPMPTSDKC